MSFYIPTYIKPARLLILILSWIKAIRMKSGTVAQRCFRRTNWERPPARWGKRHQIVTLFSFILAGCHGAVLDNLDGHPEDTPNLVIEVNKDVRVGRARENTTYYHFAQDHESQVQDDDEPWYQIKDE